MLRNVKFSTCNFILPQFGKHLRPLVLKFRSHVVKMKMLIWYYLEWLKLGIFWSFIVRLWIFEQSLHIVCSTHVNRIYGILNHFYLY